MDALFSEVKIYAPFGQRYEPVDAGMVLSYREAVDGQILEEGITEAGSMGSFTAAGTAYATHGQAVIPFYIYYSMFGYQRVGDLIWAFGDSRGRGFMLGGTAGRTTLNGEGLQHEDGHSPLLFSAIPNVRIYDPAFAYELATVIRDGMRRMYVDGEDIFYYITLYNENYPMPPMPEGSEDGILRGLYLYKPAGRRAHPPRPDSSPAAAPSRRRSRRRRCCSSSTTSPPRCGAPRASSCCARTRSRSSAGTGCIPTPSRASRTSRSSWAATTDRSSR